jgi:hypothetical protein
MLRIKRLRAHSCSKTKHVGFDFAVAFPLFKLCAYATHLSSNSTKFSWSLFQKQSVFPTLIPFAFVTQGFGSRESKSNHHNQRK